MFQTILISFFVPFTLAQDPIGCYIHGECVHSMYVDISTQHSPIDCLEFCKETPECNYFTHLHQSGACYAFSNCIEVNSTTCNDCLSGEATCDLDECFEPGFCTGTLIDDLPVENSAECLALCQANPECIWFSFKNGFCALTSDCSSLKSCSNCAYGLRYCSADYEDSLFVLVGGGNTGAQTNSTELVNLEQANSSCPGLPNLPIEHHENFALRKSTGEPMFCGGYYNEKTCRYLKDGSWIQGDDLLYEVYDPAVIDMGNGEYWIVGGTTSKSQYYKNGKFIPGPDIPESWKHQCGLKINETHYFFCGSLEATHDPYMFDNSTGVFTRLAADGFTFGYAPSCGLIKSGEEIVVAGGRLRDGDELSSTNITNILNIQTLSWRNGPNLPQKRGHSSDLPWRNSFITIGGVGDHYIGDYYNSILFFDSEKESWVELPGKMEIARDSLGAMFASRQELGC